MLNSAAVIGVAAVVLAIILLPPQGVDSYYFLLRDFGSNIVVFKLTHLALFLTTIFAIYKISKTLGGNPTIAILLVLGSMATLWRLLVFELDDFLGSLLALYGVYVSPVLGALLATGVGAIFVWRGLVPIFFAMLAGVLWKTQSEDRSLVDVAVAVLVSAGVAAYLSNPAVSEHMIGAPLLGASIFALPFVFDRFYLREKNIARRAGFMTSILLGVYRLKFAALTALTLAPAASRVLREHEAAALGILSVILFGGVMYTMFTDPFPSQQLLDQLHIMCMFAREAKAHIINDFSFGYWIEYVGCRPTYRQAPPAEYKTPRHAVYVFFEEDLERLLQRADCRYIVPIFSLAPRGRKIVAVYCG